MRGDIKIGIIARADNTGLGIESWEFCRHFPDTKVLVVSFESLGSLYKIYPKRFNDPIIVDKIPNNFELREFIKDIDLLFTIETPYNDRAYDIARSYGVKSVLRINYEWTRNNRADFYISPSLFHFNNIPGPKAYLPFPINRQVLPFKLRKKARKFIHIAGNGKAGYDRNGTGLLLKAIPLVKNKDIEIIIKTQREYEHENYWEAWEDADVYVSPRRYAGQSLPLNEAMSLGMAVIMTDMAPQNDFLPKQLLIKPKLINPLKIAKTIEIADIDPKDIAAKIDEIAGQDITKYSQISDQIAEAWSWETLKPKYIKLFKQICSSNWRT